MYSMKRIQQFVHELLRLRRTCRRTHGLEEPQGLVDLGSLARLVPLELLAHSVGNGADRAFGGAGVQERQPEPARQHILGGARAHIVVGPARIR